MTRNAGRRLTFRFHNALSLLLAAMILLPCYAVISIMIDGIYHDTYKDFLDAQQKVLFQSSYLLEAAVDSINSASAYVFLNTSLYATLEAANNGTEAERFFAKETLQTFLENISTTLYSIQAEFAITLLDGTVITVSRTHKLENPPPDYPWYEDVIQQNGLPFWSRSMSFIHGENRADAGLTCARVLLSGSKKTLGILTVFVPDEALWSKLHSLDLSYRGNTYFVTRENSVLSRSIRDLGLKPYDQSEAVLEALKTARRENLMISVDNDLQVLIFPVSKSGFYLVNEISAGAMLESTARRMTSTKWFIALSLASFVAVAFIISRLITGPLVRLTRTIERFGDGELARRAPDSRLSEVQVMSDAFNAMADRILRLIHDVKRQSDLQKEAHFNMLRAQIQPHFLFNTLNDIRWMALLNGADAVADGIEQLGGILRETLNTTRRDAPLSKELELLQAYVRLQKLRYGNTFEFTVSLPEALQACLVPKFILQPIIENAIFHGVSGRPNGSIHLFGERDGQNLRIIVSDNGCGVPEEQLSRMLETDVPEPIPGGQVSGLGIRNIHERLRLLFGEAYGVRLQNASEGGLEVLITIPLAWADEGGSAR